MRKLSVSVCLSNAWIVTKRKKVLPRFYTIMKERLSQFSDTKNGWWKTSNRPNDKYVKSRCIRSNKKIIYIFMPLPRRQVAGGVFTSYTQTKPAARYSGARETIFGYHSIIIFTSFTVYHSLLFHFKLIGLLTCSTNHSQCIGLRCLTVVACAPWAARRFSIPAWT